MIFNRNKIQPRASIINHLIKRFNYKKYLEIGYYDGTNFSHINADIKYSVDPYPLKHTNSHRMTSDEFFKNNSTIFDIIFVDGLHHSDQVYKDIVNSLKFLSERGTIVCHDMNPKTEKEQLVPRVSKHWTGDCWKAFVKLRSENNDLEMFVVDIDHGIGIIRRKIGNKFELSDSLTYRNLVKHRVEWLNLMSYKQYLNIRNEF